MRDFAFSAALLGIVHTSIVLLPAWLLCRGPIRTGRASHLVRSMTVVVFVLLFAAFLPIPDYTSSAVGKVVRWAMPSHVGAQSGSKSLGELTFMNAVDQIQWQTAGAEPTGIEFSAHQVPPPISKLARDGLPLLIRCAFFLTACFLARQLLGLGSLAWLCRKSSPVLDSHSLDTLQTLRLQLGCSDVELRSTKMLSAAATAGWFRPVILLPHDFHCWSNEELRAALAHEMAHVRQSDFVWRLLASWYAALHCCNPLAHWLHRRLVLEQELSADRTASQLLGDSRKYSRALFGLAMRAERTNSTVCIPGLLSVTSTNLIRRIEMLRAKESSTRAKDGPWRLIGFVFFATLTLVATGLRVSAEVPATKVVSSQPGRSVTSFDPSQLPVSKQGVFVVRLSELVGETMGPYGPSIRDLLTTQLATMGVADIAVEKIETVAGNLNVQVKHVGKTIEPGDEGHEHQLIFSVDGMVIRLRSPQDMKARIQELFPDSEPMDESQGVYLLRQISQLGPYRLRAKIVDDRNVAISFTPDGHKWLDSYPKVSSPTPSWVDSWKAIDTGAVTVLFDQSKIKWPATLKTWPREVQNVLAKTEVFGIGFSAGMPMRLTCAATAGDDISVDLKQDLKAALETASSGPGSRFLTEWVKNLVVSQTGRTVRFHGPIDFSSGEAKSEDHQVAAADVPLTNAVQLHAKLLKLDVQKLRKLNVEHVVADDVASESYSSNDIRESLVMHLNRFPKASSALVDRLRKEGICEVLAAPTMCTIFDQPCVCTWGTESLKFVPQFDDKRNHVDMKLELTGSVDFQKEMSARPGETHFLPLPAKSEDSSQLVLAVRTELVAEVPMPRTAKRPSPSSSR